MERRNDEVAKVLADDIVRMSPLDCNITAALTAQIIASGKTKCELQDVCQFLQMLLAALKSYMR